MTSPGCPGCLILWECSTHLRQRSPGSYKTPNSSSARFFLLVSKPCNQSSSVGLQNPVLNECMCKVLHCNKDVFLSQLKPTCYMHLLEEKHRVGNLKPCTPSLPRSRSVILLGVNWRPLNHIKPCVWSTTDGAIESILRDRTQQSRCFVHKGHKSCFIPKERMPCTE